MDTPDLTRVRLREDNRTMKLSERTITRRLLLPLIIVGAFILGGVAAASMHQYMSPADPTNPTAMRGCVIRFDTLSSSGNSVVPRIHANESHHCVGVTGLGVEWDPGWAHGDLLVHNTGGPGTVVSLVVDEDETLTQRGIDCGGSGGGEVTRIQCWDDDGNKVPVYSVSQMYGSTTNLWLSWTMWMPPS